MYAPYDSPNFPRSLKSCIDTTKFLAWTIVEESGPNWVAWVIMLLRLLENHAQPLFFAKFLEDVKFYIDQYLETGHWDDISQEIPTEPDGQ